MADIWFISDTHFFHDNILRFQIAGTLERARPFDSVAHMNEYMVENWNERIKPQDKVWHLGDVAFKPTYYRRVITTLLHSLNGHKRMLLGNHDNVEAMVQTGAFEKIQLWNSFKKEGFTISHIPLMLGQLRNGPFNVHGHLHHNVIDDPHYINICVEKTDYKPIHMDELLAEMDKRNLEK